MIPLAILGLFLAASLVDSGWNIYSTHKTTQVADNYQKYVQNFYSGAQSENTAYWERYIRAHHLEDRKILFPYRTGYNFNESGLYSADYGLTQNEYNRYGSYVHGATGTARGLGAGATASGILNRYRATPNTRDFYPMYQ